RRVWNKAAHHRHRIGRAGGRCMAADRVARDGGGRVTVGRERSRSPYPPVRDDARTRDRFDPIHEGARFGLTPAHAIAIWARLAGDAEGRRGSARSPGRISSPACRFSRERPC
ncbi:MAG TPA: hypothetical protein VFP84_27920, partial [Kofleriaceae bacterium]|nr:hypothetical protein [Kofleriaceae bacterium]